MSDKKLGFELLNTSTVICDVDLLECIICLVISKDRNKYCNPDIAEISLAL